MNRRNTDDAAMFVSIGVALVALYLVWQFSNLFGLDMNTAGSVCLRLLLLGALIFISLKFGEEFEPVEFRNIWPVLLAMLWACFWPALDFWATKNSMPFSLAGDVARVWWNAWYTEWGVFLAIIGLGYWIRAMWN